VGDSRDPVLHRPLDGPPFMVRGGHRHVPAADGRHVAKDEHRHRHDQQPRDQRGFADPPPVVTGRAGQRDHQGEHDAGGGEHGQQPLPGRHEPPPGRRSRPDLGRRGLHGAGECLRHHAGVAPGSFAQVA